uniref:Uncharacterized protein n=1 Tax=Rhizophora mucronata TaxID=61149 RepID=A0A2P2P7P9_RHIMU
MVALSTWLISRWPVEARWALKTLLGATLKLNC